MDLETLKNSCDKIEVFSYMKKFTPEELAELKTVLSDLMINTDAIETELKDVKSEFKEKLDPLRDKIKEHLTWIRDKAKIIREECYINFEGEYAIYYNGDGEEVHKRPLEVSERQKTIQMQMRAVNQ